MSTSSLLGFVSGRRAERGLALDDLWKWAQATAEAKSSEDG